MGSAAASGPIMLRAQTSGDAEGTVADPNTDAVFVSSDHGASWQHVADEAVQKRMCHPFPLTAGDAAAPAALASIGVALTEVQEGTLCVPYAFHPTPEPPGATCQAQLNAYCNNATLNGARCIDAQKTPV